LATSFGSVTPVNFMARSMRSGNGLPLGNLITRDRCIENWADGPAQTVQDRICDGSAEAGVERNFDTLSAQLSEELIGMGHWPDGWVGAVVPKHSLKEFAVQSVDELLRGWHFVFPLALDENADSDWLGHPHHVVDFVTAHGNPLALQGIAQADIHRVIVTNGRSRHVQYNQSDFHRKTNAPFQSAAVYGHLSLNW
jgi:hypothetical protein